MILKKVSAIIFVILLSVSFSFSQNNLLKGRVTFLDSIPIRYATITVKSTKQELSSDSIGNFSINCNFPEKIKVKANGFIAETVKIEEGDTAIIVNLKLKSTKDAMEEANASGHVKDMVKFQTMVSAKVEKDFSNYRNVYDIIIDSSSGVTKKGNDIIIRGTKSLGTDAALIILDGIPVPSSKLIGLSPVTIQRVNVLKGSYAAIYGVRGANGVVEITTKRGGDK